MAAASVAGCESVGQVVGATSYRVPAPALTGKVIHSVRGPISPLQLGITSMHEHVILGDDSDPDEGDPLQIYDQETLQKMMHFAQPEDVPESFFPQGPDHPITLENRAYLEHYYHKAEGAFALDEPLMTAEIGDFKKQGGQSILDVSITNERGDPRTIRHMSEVTGVNIMMSTGINSHVLIPKKYKVMSEPELIAFFEKELNVGIRDTGILAANIKLLAEGPDTDLPPSRDETLIRALKAAANVSRNTGAPVTVHCYALGDEEFDGLLKTASAAGMPKDRMTIAHFPTELRPMQYEALLNDPDKLKPNLDIGYRAMDDGFILSFDLFGAGEAWKDTGDGQVPNDDLIALAAIYQYAKRGYADRIVLGTDVWTRLGTRRFGGRGIAQLLNYVVPTLKKYGVSQADIDQIMIQNPARILAYRTA